MECYGDLRNIQDLLSDRKTPYERRFGMPFDGPVIPFGAMVEYRPISAKDPSRLHQFGPKSLARYISRLCIVHAGGIWKGDIMVADKEELEEMDASELHARKFNVKEVLTPQRSGNFIFPVADGTVKIFGGEQRLRTSTSTRDCPERGEEQEVLQHELHSPTPHQEDSTRDDEEAKLKVTSGQLQENSFIVITLNPESNCTCRKENNIPFRRSASTLPERLTHPLMYCSKNILMITGTWMEREYCLMHGQDSQESFH